MYSGKSSENKIVLSRNFFHLLQQKPTAHKRKLDHHGPTSHRVVEEKTDNSNKKVEKQKKVEADYEEDDFDNFGSFDFGDFEANESRYLFGSVSLI